MKVLVVNSLDAEQGAFSISISKGRVQWDKQSTLQTLLVLQNESINLKRIYLFIYLFILFYSSVRQ